MTPAVTALLSIGSTLIDKIFPDKKQADLVKLRLIKLERDGQLAELASETELAKGQIAVNTE